MRNMNTVISVRQQLTDLCQKVGVSITSCGAESSEPVRKALLGGLFTNVAEHRGEGRYHTVRCRLLCLPIITTKSANILAIIVLGPNRQILMTVNFRTITIMVLVTE